MSEDEFRAFSQGSPLRRAGRSGLARNAAIVLGNSGERRYLPILEEASVNHQSADVREIAAWAMTRLEEE